MYQKLVSHNDDIKRLVEKGYAVAFDSNYLIIRDIPYLNDQRELKIGAIVAKLVFTDQLNVTQTDHQIYFAGSFPHNIDRKPIPNLGGGPTSIPLSDACCDVVVERSFSNKPRENGGKFKDFFDKIESYVTIISGPAIELHNANPYTFRYVDGEVSDSVFKLHDTMTSRAEITDLSAIFKNDIIAIIGLGGTGAYLLDFLAKMPVKEIHAFDADPLHVHNVFRSPGKYEHSELGKTKAEVYHSRYDNFRTGLFFEPKFIDDSCHSELEKITFAFVCVDKGSSRANIFNVLLSKKIPFIDVGMGLKRKENMNNLLKGTLRTTYYPAENGQRIRDMNLAEVSANSDNLYKTNIQIAELNALNACFAVIRFKQLRGFYFEDLPLFHFLFDTKDFKVTGESSFNEN